jgi:hypothetical protein
MVYAPQGIAVASSIRGLAGAPEVRHARSAGADTDNAAPREPLLPRPEVTLAVMMGTEADPAADRRVAGRTVSLMASRPLPVLVKIAARRSERHLAPAKVSLGAMRSVPDVAD